MNICPLLIFTVLLHATQHDLLGERERERKRKLERQLKLSGGLMPVPQVQCVYARSTLSVPSMIYVYPAGGRIQLT